MSSGEKIKVLIVDDSFFMRKLLRDIVNSDKEIEVVGEANNGRDAVEKVKELNPDVVTMDYNMPEMDGAEATNEILCNDGPKPAIIIVSAHTRHGIEETLKSLRAGAMDFISKPSGEVSLDIEKVKNKLLEKIKIAKKANIIKCPSRAKKVRPKKIQTEHKVMNVHQVVVLNASTGGPPVIEEIINNIPRDFPSPILIVQHMPEGFTENFAKILDKNAPCNVKEAQEKDVIMAGNCYIIPSGYHGVIEYFEDEEEVKKIIHLTKELKVNGYRPSMDVLLKSVADKYKQNVVAVILTGMGMDGIEGARYVKSAGGHVIVQSPETAVVDTIISGVMADDIEDEILEPTAISKSLIKICK